MNVREITIHNAQIDIECAKLEIKYQRVSILIQRLFIWESEEYRNIVLANNQFNRLLKIRENYHNKRVELWKKKFF